MCKFFLTTNLILYASLFACATNFNGRGDADIGLATSKEIYSYMSKDVKSTKPFLGRNIFYPPEISHPRLFKNFFCQNGGKQSILKQRLVATIPKYFNVPVTSSAQVYGDLRKRFKEMAKGFFAAIVKTDSRGPLFYTSDLDKIRDLNNSGDVFIYLYSTQEDSYFMANVSRKLIGSIEQPYGWNAGGVFSAEISAITYNFIPIAPDEEWKPILGEYFKKPSHICSSQWLTNNFFQKGGITSSSSYNEICWGHIFEYATSVKEAVSEQDPNSTIFDVQLDLDFFCKYARPVDDFMTK